MTNMKMILVIASACLPQQGVLHLEVEEEFDFSVVKKDLVAWRRNWGSYPGRGVGWCNVFSDSAAGNCFHWKMCSLSLLSLG